MYKKFPDVTFLMKTAMLEKINHPVSEKSALGVWDADANSLLREYAVSGDAYRLYFAKDALFVQVYGHSARRMHHNNTYARDLAMILKMDAGCRKVIFYPACTTRNRLLVY